MITKESIDRFLKNECTADDKRLIADYLEKHPELLDIYFPEEEVADLSEGKQLDEEISGRLLRNVQRNTYTRYSLYRFMKVGVAAASVILLATAGWFYFNQKENVVVIAKTSKPEKRPLIHKFNVTDQKLSLSLPDGSTVELAPGSDIKYSATFITDSQRLVYLTGEAFFNVAKDKQHPFKVNSGEIISTVLGTSFRIISNQKDKLVRVQLHTGKLLIEPAKGQNDKWQKPIYLSPGQELSYNKQQMLASVQPFNKAGNKMASKSDGRIVTPQWYMFEGQSLSEVLDQLSQYYGVEIDYRPSDVKEMYFAGKFDKNDSLDGILKDIVLLNRLTISKQKDKYLIRKPS